MVCIFQRTLQ